MRNNQIQIMVNQLVDWYAERKAGLLTLVIDQIPESDLNALVALILSKNDDLAAEASGPDNPEFFTAIMPAMIRALNMPKNGFESEYFRDVQISAIKNYLIPKISVLIADRLEELNEDTECHTSLIWDRAREKTIEMPNPWRGLRTR
jgi:hypothetical protein